MSFALSSSATGMATSTSSSYGAAAGAGGSSSSLSRLTDDTVKAMATAKIFKDNTARINSMDFFHDGSLLVTAGDDESIHLYNAQTGSMQTVLYSKKYGVDLVRWTHSASTVICASKNKWDESLRYLSLHDNRYLRYFKGHRDRVVSLAMSPKDDSFLSGSLDETVRLWDLRSPLCQGLLRRRGRPVVNFDPQGLIFAVGTAPNAIKLYELRSFDRGPFSTFAIDYPRLLDFSHLKFSDDGRFILVASLDGPLILLDAFTGDRLHTFTSHLPPEGGTGAPSSAPAAAAAPASLEPSFSPDGQYVLSGSEDGTVHVWGTLTGEVKAVWKGHASGAAVGSVLWNPRSMMVASACTSLVWWIPAPSES